MKMLYLGTSAVNHLFNDSRAFDLKKNIQKVGVVYPSVFNIAELASTSNQKRRLGLLKLIKEISGGYRPLAMPGELLRRSLAAVSIWATDMDHSMGPEWEGVWIALNDPGQIDEQAYREIIEWKSSLEQWYQHMHERGRLRMQEVIRRLPQAEFAALTSRFSRLIQLYPPESEFVVDFVHDMASHSGSDVTIDRELVQRILRHSEHWRFFLASMIYGMHARSVRTTHFGKDTTPGSIDTQQSIYLASCDIFVTADRQQHRMLRLLAPFGHKKRRIWDYIKFAQFVC